jgi:hypothetical protein
MTLLAGWFNDDALGVDGGALHRMFIISSLVAASAAGGVPFFVINDGL